MLFSDSPNPASYLSAAEALDWGLVTEVVAADEFASRTAELAAWFPQRASIPGEVGAVGWMEWDGHPRFAVRIEAFEPERFLAWHF